MLYSINRIDGRIEKHYSHTALKEYLTDRKLHETTVEILGHFPTERTYFDILYSYEDLQSRKNS